MFKEVHSVNSSGLVSTLSTRRASNWLITYFKSKIGSNLYGFSTALKAEIADQENNNKNGYGCHDQIYRTKRKTYISSEK